MKKEIFGLLIITFFSAFIVGCASSKKADATAQSQGGAPSTEEIFAQLDSDKDGKLSKTEVKGPLANDFAKIDTNSDGYISKEELNKAPKPSGQRPSQGQGGQQGPPPGRN